MIYKKNRCNLDPSKKYVHNLTYFLKLIKKRQTIWELHKTQFACNRDD